MERVLIPDDLSHWIKVTLAHDFENRGTDRVAYIKRDEVISFQIENDRRTNVLRICLQGLFYVHAYATIDQAERVILRGEDK